MTWTRRILVGSFLAAACTEPVAPFRSPRYPFTGKFGDVFHWPADRLPVRVYPDARGDLRALAANAIGLWERQFLYGEFRGVIVNDSNTADVIVRWTDSVPPATEPDPGPPVPACGGVTQLIIDSTGVALAGPLEIEITIFAGTVFTDGQVEACVRRTTVHELAHALGLFQHAIDTLAIMFATPLVNEPAPIDQRTVQVLYHTPSTLAPPPQRP